MNQQLVVLKYGRSVVQAYTWLSAVVHEIFRYYGRGRHVVVIVSAIGRHTELLLDEQFGLPVRPYAMRHSHNFRESAVAWQFRKH